MSAITVYVDIAFNLYVSLGLRGQAKRQGDCSKTIQCFKKKTVSLKSLDIALDGFLN